MKVLVLRTFLLKGQENKYEKTFKIRIQKIKKTKKFLYMYTTTINIMVTAIILEINVEPYT